MNYAQKKEKAVLLRKQGYSYNLIAQELGISKSTLSLWLVNIPYLPNQTVIERIGLARAKAGEIRSRHKRDTWELAQKLALKRVGKMSVRDSMFFGLGLYVGEGQKNETVGVINSDPRVIKATIKWLCQGFGLGLENFTLAIHLYPDNNREACLNYWSEITGISRSQFGKTQIDTRKDKVSGKRGKLQYGTAHLRVRANGNKEFGVLLSRQIHSMMQLVLK